MDKYSGQSQIVYKEDGQEFLYWAHLNNPEEIAPFMTRAAETIALQQKINEMEEEQQGQSEQRGNSNHHHHTNDEPQLPHHAHPPTNAHGNNGVNGHHHPAHPNHPNHANHQMQPPPPSQPHAPHQHAHQGVDNMNGGGMVLISNNQSPSNLQGAPQDVTGNALNTFPSGNEPQRQMMNGYGANGGNIGNMGNIGNIKGAAPPNGIGGNPMANPMNGPNGMGNGMDASHQNANGVYNGTGNNMAFSGQPQPPSASGMGLNHNATVHGMGYNNHGHAAPHGMAANMNMPNMANSKGPNMASHQKTRSRVLPRTLKNKKLPPKPTKSPKKRKQGMNGNANNANHGMNGGSGGAGNGANNGVNNGGAMNGGYGGNNGVNNNGAMNGVNGYNVSGNAMTHPMNGPLNGASNMKYHGAPAMNYHAAPTNANVGGYPSQNRPAPPNTGYAPPNGGHKIHTPFNSQW